MATTTQLTLEQYHAQYAHQAGWEFRRGEAIRKPVPTTLHAILQYILCAMLWEAGYVSGSEIDLRIAKHWQPRPDVTADLNLEEPYPTKPVQIVCEILSDDQMKELLEKCADYALLGIEQVFVFEPESHTIFVWNRAARQLDRVTDMNLANGRVIAGVELWQRFEARRRRRRPETGV